MALAEWGLVPEAIVNWTEERLIVMVEAMGRRKQREAGIDPDKAETAPDSEQVKLSEELFFARAGIGHEVEHVD